MRDGNLDGKDNRRPMSADLSTKRRRKSEHGLEVASPRGREIGFVEFTAASPGDVSKDALATEPMEVAVVVLGLRTAWPGSTMLTRYPHPPHWISAIGRRLCNR